MHYLSKDLTFPAVEEATPDGLLAVGGDLSTERLLLAYRSGIFPWYEEGQPILWWSPNPRMVLFPSKFKVSKSLRKTIASGVFQITFNSEFEKVITQCETVKRNGQYGTWITDEMKKAYTKLHELGYAISFETWLDGTLVGGGYGIDLHEYGVFCGESMFSLVSDASKVGFFHLVKQLKEKNYNLVDCQVYTKHLESLGASEISRKAFVNYLTP